MDGRQGTARRRGIEALRVLTFTCTAIRPIAPYGLPALTEAPLIALAAIGGCAALYEVVIRRSFWLRPLFGLKPVQRMRRPAVGLR